MSRRCELLAGRTEKGYVVRVQGIGTCTHSPALRDFATDCFARSPDETVTVDLLSCEYLDSTFLGCLLKLQRIGSPARFQIVADENVRKRLLASTQLDKYLSLVSTAPVSDGKFLRIDPKSHSSQELGRHIMEAHEALSEVPSEVSSTFRRIAAQLKSDLEEKDRSKPSLTDTAVLPLRRK
jgi:anti-anti-sigma regulatory factor